MLEVTFGGSVRIVDEQRGHTTYTRVVLDTFLHDWVDGKLALVDHVVRRVLCLGECTISEAFYSPEQFCGWVFSLILRFSRWAAQSTKNVWLLKRTESWHSSLEARKVDSATVRDVPTSVIGKTSVHNDFTSVFTLLSKDHLANHQYRTPTNHTLRQSQ